MRAVNSTARVQLFIGLPGHGLHRWLLGPSPLGRLARLPPDTRPWERTPQHPSLSPQPISEHLSPCLLLLPSSCPGHLRSSLPAACGLPLARRQPWCSGSCPVAGPALCFALTLGSLGHTPSPAGPCALTPRLGHVCVWHTLASRERYSQTCFTTNTF